MRNSLLRRCVTLIAIVFVLITYVSAQSDQPLQWVHVTRKGPNEISLKWSRYPVQNFKRYRLIRNDGKVANYNYEQVLDSIPNQGVTEYSDTRGIQPDQQYHYYIKVIGDQYAVLTTTDRWGDVGRWANLKPVEIVISNVEQDGRSVNLQWEQSNAPEFYEYAVFRTQQPDDLKRLSGVHSLDQVNALPGRAATFQRKPEATSFTDGGLTPNETYYYFVAVVSTDQQAMLSRPATIKMPPPLPEQLNPVLRSSLDSTTITLAWSGYRGRDFERYWLVRMYTQSGTQTSRTDTFAVPVVDSVYRDLGVVPGNYTYQLGVKTADHGVVASNWTSIAIRPKRVGASYVRIWITGESIKSTNGNDYDIHPFFLNDYENELFAAGYILQSTGPGKPLFPYVAYQSKGKDQQNPKKLYEWLKAFSINSLDDSRLLALENALFVAIHAESHSGTEEKFQDSLVTGAMGMSVRDTAGMTLMADDEPVAGSDPGSFIADRLRHAYPRMMALELAREHRRFMLAAGGGAIALLFLVGVCVLWLTGRRRSPSAAAQTPETIGEYMKRSQDAAFLEKLGKQLSTVSSAMMVSDALRQILAKLENSAPASFSGELHHHPRASALDPALVQALIHLHQMVEHNFGHYGNYERFSAHQAENVITDYVKVAKAVLTLPIDGEKFGQAPSPHDIEKKLSDGTKVLMHVFEEIQHERGLLRKVKEEADVLDVKDVHEKVKLLKRAASTIAAIQGQLERGGLLAHQTSPLGLHSAEEFAPGEAALTKRLEGLIREKAAVDQKLAVAFPTDDEQTRLASVLDQVLKIQHQLHIKSVSQIASEVDGIARYAEGYLDIAQELKKSNPTLAIGEPQAVRGEFKKRIGG